MASKIDRVLRVVVALALVLSTVPAVQAQTPSTKAKAAPGKPQPATAAKPAVASNLRGAGGQEGIKVHGDWTIVIRGPDGTEVARHEFKNRIASTGMQMLVQAMDRDVSFGRWKVALMSTPPAGGGACGTNAAPLACGIKEPGAFDQVALGFPIAFTDDLRKASDFSDPNSPKFVLTNSTAPGLRATRDDTINRVLTFVEVCSPATAPNAPCQNTLGLTSWLFTEAIAGITPGFGGVPVQAGQLIDVTVKLSFF